MRFLIYLFAAAAIVFPCFIISKTFERLPKRQDKAKEEAIKKGNVVEATLERTYWRNGGTEKDQHRENQCDYVYEVNGKQYKYTIYNNNPPSVLRLYYLKNPRKAAVQGAIDVSGKPWLLRFAIVAAIITVIAEILVNRGTM